MGGAGRVVCTDADAGADTPMRDAETRRVAASARSRARAGVR